MNFCTHIVWILYAHYICIDNVLETTKGVDAVVFNGCVIRKKENKCRTNNPILELSRQNM